jgi:hypothetical protein
MGEAVKKLNDQLSAYDRGSEPLTPEEEYRRRMKEARMNA